MGRLPSCFCLHSLSVKKRDSVKLKTSLLNFMFFIFFFFPVLYLAPWFLKEKQNIKKKCANLPKLWCIKLNEKMRSALQTSDHQENLKKLFLLQNIYFTQSFFLQNWLFSSTESESAMSKNDQLFSEYCQRYLDGYGMVRFKD